MESTKNELYALSRLQEHRRSRVWMPERDVTDFGSLTFMLFRSVVS